jgi:Skp family chaperone for outer membrane proteins
MKQLLASAALAAALLAGTAQVAFAAPPTTPIAQGIAIANLEAVVANSNAFKVAAQQRPVTYKPQIDAAEARRQAIAAQLQPLVTKFNADRQAAKPNNASLQQQAASIQRINEAGQAELQQMLAPVALSEAYVEEQITERLQAAVDAAMNKQRITLLLSPGDVISAAATYNLNQAILNELNTLIPSAQLVPPQNWEPRQIREQRAAQAAAQGQAPAAPGAAPAAPQPTGR